jgi:hypothetical protein
VNSLGHFLAPKTYDVENQAGRITVELVGALEGASAALFRLRIQPDEEKASAPTTDLFLFDDDPLKGGHQPFKLAAILEGDSDGSYVLARLESDDHMTRLRTLSPPDSSDPTFQAISNRSREIQNGEPLTTLLKHRSELNSSDMSDFITIMETARRDLYSELLEVVREQKLVFLTGGPSSFLPAFVHGFFRSELPGGPYNRLRIIVSASEYDKFLSFYPKDFHSPDLDAFFALVAQHSLVQLWHSKPHQRRLKPGIFSLETLNDSERFCREYTLKRNGDGGHVECVKTFFAVLARALKELAWKDSLTLLLPFEGIEEVINRRDFRNGEKLWGALGVMQKALTSRTLACENLGLILQAQRLPLAKMLVSLANCGQIALRLPPLSMSEIRNISEQFLREKLNPDFCSDLLLETGGDPRFLSILLEAYRAQRGSEEPSQKLRLATDVVKSLILGQPGVAPTDLPDIEAVSTALAQYRDESAAELKRPGAVPQQALLNRWRLPDGNPLDGSHFDDKIQPWLDCGLIWLARRGKSEISSRLQVLDNFTLSKAGLLPYALGRRLHDSIGGMTGTPT